MSEPDFRKMGDPLNDRLPPKREPKTPPPQQDDVRCTCGHREEDHAGGNCLQGELLDACDCYGFQPWIDR